MKNIADVFYLYCQLLILDSIFPFMQRDWAYMCDE